MNEELTAVKTRIAEIDSELAGMDDIYDRKLTVNIGPTTELKAESPDVHQMAERRRQLEGEKARLQRREQELL